VTLTGTLLGGRYRVGEPLGEGGMGTVYAAVQEGLDRRVALKVMHPHLSSDTELRGRFQREAHVVAMLGHPNVVQISDFQTNEDEPPFLVMELLHGENLRDVLKRTPRLEPARVAYIAVQVLSALEAAHRAKVVHRDIKPDNIFLERTSVQADIVKVLDFGVAKLMSESDTAPKLTRSGLVVGTLAYMAPEQATGDPIDGRADLYSLAAVMYVALVGKKPFEAPSTSELVQAIMTTTPKSVATIVPSIDADLSRVIDRALSKLPDDRFATAAEMAHALQRFAKPTVLDDATSQMPATPVMTVRTPATAIEPHALPPETAPLPKTITMDAVPETVAPRTTPIPPPTQRSSYHPHTDGIAATTAPMKPAMIAAAKHANAKTKRKRSALPWIVSIAIASLVILVAGGTLLAIFRPWESPAPAAPSASAKR
jgi:serine/threonine-protein kinase